MQLTGDVVVVVTLELQAHVVGTELLELDGELDVLLGLVAVDQDVGVQDGAAGLSLLLLHQVELVELVRPRAVPLRADDVQFVPDLGVDRQPLPLCKTEAKQTNKQTNKLNTLVISRAKGKPNHTNDENMV